MNKLQKGFTFAEALMTLGIIGVIASLTLPSLSTNAMKSQTGPALAKAINTLETANKLALEEGNARTLDQLCPTNTAAYFDEVLGPYIQWRKESLSKPYYQYNNTTSYGTGATDMYTTKDGITFLRSSSNKPISLSEAQTRSLSSAFSGKYYFVFVDTNGNRKGPNALGKDLFYLYVDTKGTVIPYGGAASAEYFNRYPIAWSSGGCDSPKNAPTNALSCAGSIVDNGYKVIY